MTYIFKTPTHIDFNKAGVQGSIFPTKNLTDTSEFIIITTKRGHSTSIIEHKCTFCYFILEGSGMFVIDGKTENCKVGDLVVISAGHQFTYKGKLKMLLSVTPPFWPEQEETVIE